MSSKAKPKISDEKLRILFALLFSSPEPVNQDRIRETLYPQPTKRAEKSKKAEQEKYSPKQHLLALETWMQERQLPLVLQQVGTSWRLLTSEEVAPALEQVRKQVHGDRLGPAAMEVLALVAYRQPVMKADIDAIRGANSSSHLRHLLDLRLIRLTGRAEVPGRPFLYGTTREFLDRFGLKDLQDLPEAGRIAFPKEVASEASAEQEVAAEDAAAAGETGDQSATAASELPETVEARMQGGVDSALDPETDADSSTEADRINADRSNK